MNSVNNSTATRTQIPGRPTDFVVHKDFNFEMEGCNNIIDFTEKRLLRIAKETKDSRYAKNVLELCEKFCNGEVAISWKDGKPKYLNVDSVE